MNTEQIMQQAKAKRKIVEVPITDYKKEIIEDSKIVGMKNVRTRDAVTRKIEKNCNSKLDEMEEEK